MRQYVRKHYRRKPNSKGLIPVHEYKRMVGKVEKEFGKKFIVEPKLSFKNDRYGGTNTVEMKVDKASVQVDAKTAKKNKKLAKTITLHELRENLYNQHFIPKIETNDDPAHDYAMSKEGDD